MAGTTLTPSNNDLHRGADALHQLIKSIQGQVIDGIDVTIEENDNADFSLMTRMVEASLQLNLQHSNAGHREGFLRALTDALYVVNGSFPAGYDPIGLTAYAFEPRRLT